MIDENEMKRASKRTLVDTFFDGAIIIAWKGDRTLIHVFGRGKKAFDDVDQTIIEQLEKALKEMRKGEIEPITGEIGTRAAIDVLSHTPIQLSKD